MNEQILRKLWVIKFCLKVVYPKYNYYTFLVFLAIKYRIQYQKRNLNLKNMDIFEVKTIPLNTAKLLVKDILEENFPVFVNKCIIISKEQFIQLASENLFYIDNGVLWLVLKLPSQEKLKHKERSSSNNETRFNFHFMTSELHKKLWNDTTTSQVNNLRVVPVVGSKCVSQNVAFTNESEYHNIISCFGLNMAKDITVSFHPMPNLDSSPKIAALAEASLVVNEYDLENDFIKEVLNNHFNTPKLMTINDIFSIELTPEITAKYHYKYLDLVGSAGRLYFKCKKLSSDVNDINDSTRDNTVPAFFIIKGVTQLTLGESIHNLKPKDEYFKIHQNPNLQMLHLCPAGLQHKFNQMQEAIQPFLTGEMSNV